MNEIVFLYPNTKEPFTTSEVIAECCGVKHDTVQKLISRNQKDFEDFGLLGFEIRAVKMKRGAKYKKVYRLNEQQATLLMTFMRNTEVVKAFKKELVRQFYAMREELRAVRAAKVERRPIRQDLLHAIKMLPDSPHKQWKYKQYTDLAYIVALGKTAKQIRAERGAGKSATVSDYLTAEELATVARCEDQARVLLELGLPYQEIKAMMMRGRLLTA